MKKEILKDHWISKEFGIEVYTIPEEFPTYIYVRTENGVIHRFHPLSLENDERTRFIIKELNGRSYREISSRMSSLIAKTHDMIQSFYINNGKIPIEIIKDIERMIEDNRKRYKSPH